MNRVAGEVGEAREFEGDLFAGEFLSEFGLAADTALGDGPVQGQFGRGAADEDPIAARIDTPASFGF